ncbi:putative peptidyl-tRNA hydrolase PTRHD1 [Chironomus tepperi]|uniref:putative peptidyl-tRNA hydrolase PTRHD1 n=1 Tax=Chironomus tepperi TaxID=113505 RepID=UPI00391F10BA
MTLIQYIIIRKDLIKVLKWNLGAIIANSCHAVAAINELTKDDTITRSYLSEENLDRMHKCVLGIDNEEALTGLHNKLDSAGIIHKLWIEMPENVGVCIALKPYNKEDVQDYFKDLKLFR